MSLKIYSSDFDYMFGYDTELTIPDFVEHLFKQIKKNDLRVEQIQYVDICLDSGYLSRGVYSVDSRFYSTDSIMQWVEIWRYITNKDSNQDILDKFNL